MRMAIATLLALTTACSASDEIFSSLSALPGFIPGEHVRGNPSVAYAGRFRAEDFYRLDAVELSLTGSGPTVGTSDVIVTLHADDDGLPGPAITTLGSITAGETPDLYRLDLSGSTLLASNTNYHLVLEAASSTSVVRWDRGMHPTSSPQRLITRAGNGPWFESPVNTFQPSFAVYGTQIPAPASAFAFGSLGLFAARRRR